MDRVEELAANLTGDEWRAEIAALLVNGPANLYCDRGGVAVEALRRWLAHQLWETDLEQVDLIGLAGRLGTRLGVELGVPAEVAVREALALLVQVKRVLALAGLPVWESLLQLHQASMEFESPEQVHLLAELPANLRRLG